MSTKEEYWRVIYPEDNYWEVCESNEQAKLVAADARDSGHKAYVRNIMLTQEEYDNLGDV